MARRLALALVLGVARTATAGPSLADLPIPVPPVDEILSDSPPSAPPEGDPDAPTEPGAAVAPAMVSGSKVVLRRRDATLVQILRGPFQSSRLFTMPIADVIGAYVMTLSGDGSLLQNPGVLSSAGVLAIGFGDIAQLEYRHTAAISVTGVNAPVPAVGVQIKIPIPERDNVPAFGVALRLGVPRTEQFGGTTIEETVHDFYLVGRWRFTFAPWASLHGGARVSQANLVLTADNESTPQERLMVLPTAGWEITMNPYAKLIGEVAAAPQFRWMKDTRDASIDYGVLGRMGLRWSVIPSVIIDGSIGYQLEVANAEPTGFDAVVQWDIRLGAEVFVPWGALACRAAGAFCD
ncbi:MAG: hypothetical protein H0T79_16180 [Deltaproteobacteria bacterium]|nr:hypothetical protein [Deltaproteobacteria bacterium]